MLRTPYAWEAESVVESVNGHTDASEAPAVPLRASDAMPERLSPDHLAYHAKVIEALNTVPQLQEQQQRAAARLVEIQGIRTMWTQFLDETYALGDDGGVQPNGTIVRKGDALE